MNPHHHSHLNFLIKLVKFFYNVFFRCCCLISRRSPLSSQFIVTRLLCFWNSKNIKKLSLITLQETI
ncbi:unnamed protein product [Brassica oleracea]